MSHLKTNTKRKILFATLLSSVALSSAMPAYAQSNSTVFNYAAALSQITLNDNKIDRRTLDWRKSSLDFTFDLPAANFTDNIELLISANPQGGVNPRAPLTVQFNNDEPVVLNVDGQGFDARVTFDALKARPTRNTIRISYNAETGAECIGPQDGGWDIDLTASKIAINSRAKRRALQFREIENHLSTPGLAPRRVGLIAGGDSATQLQALAAQGIGLRIETLPDFTTDRQASDFEVIMARRSELYKYISDDSLVAGRGAAIIIPRGRPVKLVFTGDTDAEVLAGVKSFAQRTFPPARRSVTSLGEMRLQTPLKSNLIRLSSTQALSDIPAASSFSNWSGDDWASGPKSLRFDVTDPSAMTGEILLRLASSKNVSDTSKLSVRLNGESLGTTILNKRRKSVGFKIKAGTLRGKDNVLTLMPELNPNAAPSCKGIAGPNFHLGGGSKIILNTEVPSAATELSRMTATAMPFSADKGAQSYITMTGTRSDFNASLKVLARLAKTSGEGLIAADYSRTVNVSDINDKHVLFIGPSSRLPSALVQNAPRALTDALRGQVFEGDNLISSNIEKFANLDADASFKIAAQRLSQSNRIREGGVAALYGSHASGAHIIGVITNTPGQPYTASAKTISQSPYWSEIKGGVARWNESSVLTVQAAQDVAGYSAPKIQNTNFKSGFKIDTTIFDGTFNKVTDLSGWAWSGLKTFAADIANKVETMTSNNASETDVIDAPISAPKIEAPKIVVPKIKPPTIEVEKIGQDWKTAAQAQLSGANDWARKSALKLRETASNLSKSAESFNFGQSTTAIQNKLAPLGQSLLRPTPLIIIIAFLLALLGLVFTRSSSRSKTES